MPSGLRTVVVASLLATAIFSIRTAADQSSASADIQLQLGAQLLDDGQYAEAFRAFRNGLALATPGQLRVARTGLVIASLRTAQFGLARIVATQLAESAPLDAGVTALYGDALWSAGLFEEAEQAFERALSLDPNLARGHHGRARSLVARTRFDEALVEAQTALQLSPRDVDLHHTLGAVYERMGRYEEAASAFSNFVNLLPDKDKSDRADWSRSAIRFLRSFGQRTPLQLDPSVANEVHTVPFRLVNDKVIVQARVNDSPLQDFVVDTGAESTILSGSLARRVGVTPVTYTLSAGVGDVGLRGLQLARIDSLELGTLKIRNVPCLIKDPPLRNLPVREAEALSPLALGFSMIIDYGERTITFSKSLPEEAADFELPLRMHRLAMVRGTIDGLFATNFVVDTGGEVISISQATAATMDRPEPERRIALKVFGSSGWDSEAFLMSGVNLAFDAIRYNNFSVVVLNLHSPSALLGVELGGIVGHRFLSGYRVGIDLERSVLRLKALNAPRPSA